MRKKWFVYLLTCIMVLSVTGCGKITDADKDTSASTQESAEDSENVLSSEEDSGDTGDGEAGLGNEEGNGAGSSVEENETGAEQLPLTTGLVEGVAGTFTHGEISLTFPAAWEGKFYIVKNEDGLSVYQKASFDKYEYMGFLFSVHFSEEPYYDFPSGGMIAYTKDRAYYISYPTDVPYDLEDEAVGAEYNDMCRYLEEIEYSVKIASEEVHYNADEYILPMSEYYKLSENDIINLGQTQLMFARNEIYARHGYHFKNEFLQACFERCSWYEDMGEAYYATALTEIDQANIETIKAMEEKKASIYPMEVESGEDHAVDLDCDGHNEIVRFDVQIGEFEETIGTIIVEGTEYPLEDFGIYAYSLHTDYFYITDISPHFTGYEIAIPDNGPSEDLMTYFFTYDGELHYIGVVDGHPMPQLNYFNGFDAGRVIGRTRSDLLGTNYGYGSWWYDYTNGELIPQNSGAFYLEPWYAHKLLVDLPVYLAQDTESATVVMEADQVVYFLRSDGKEWVQIRDQNGTEGWVHVKSFSVENVGMGMESVFEGIYFFD